MDIIENEKTLISQIYEEDKVNKLLLNFDYKKPRNVSDIYIREQFKDDLELYNKNFSLKRKDKLYEIKYKQYSEKYKTLNKNEKNKYTKIFNEELLEFEKNQVIIKKYIFKGADGNIKFRQTGFQLFLSDELIKGLEKGFDVEQITKDSLIKWDRLDLNTKKKYYKNSEDINNILLISQNYKYINSFLVFIYHQLYKIKSKNIPSLYELAKLFLHLSTKQKIVYENYSNEFIILRFKLRDIYDAIHGIKSKTPSGALRIFLQEKAINNEIKTIKEGIDLWKILSEDEKENYLNKCHLQFLAYKYKEFIYKNKRKELFPKKPMNLFNLYASMHKDDKIPPGIKAIDYFRNSFNDLSSKNKEKLINQYTTNLEIYKKKIKIFNNKIFDFPKKPKSAFVYYFQERINLLDKEKTNIYPKQLINIILGEYLNKNFDKEKYIILYEKDKKRFEAEVEEFEKFGYYSKKYE